MCNVFEKRLIEKCTHFNAHIRRTKVRPADRAPARMRLTKVRLRLPAADGPLDGSYLNSFKIFSKRFDKNSTLCYHAEHISVLMSVLMSVL